MTDDSYRAGDVVWAPDPFNTGSNPRPWLVLAADNLPYPGEDYVCAGLTLSNLADNVAVVSEHWIHGEPDDRSYCSPWVLSTVKHDDAQPQGTLTPEFTRQIVKQSSEYLTGDTF